MKSFAKLVLSAAPVALLAAQPALAQTTDRQVEAVVVTGEHPVEALKTSSPLIETPRNIQVLSSGLLEDQGALLLEDGLRNVAGVMPGGYYAGFDYFRIRGFDASGFIYMDGLKLDTNVGTNIELFGAEQVEVAKGPSSSLYGGGSLGGLVNLVSKRPRAETFATISAAGGSFGTYQANFDGGTVLTDDGTLYGRLVATARRDGTNIDIANGLQRYYVAPSLTWAPDSATTLTFLSSYQHDNIFMGMPLPARGFILPDVNGQIPTSRFVGEPGNSNKLNGTRTSLGYELHHTFTDWISVRQNLRYTFTNTRWSNIMYPSSIDSDDENARVLSVYPFSLTENTQIFGVDTAAEAHFATGAISHTITAGVDYFRDNDSSIYHQIDYSDPASYLQIDLYNPVYTTALPAQPDVAQSLTHIDNVGLYVQDHVAWGNLALTAGLRWDRANTTSGYAGVNTPATSYAVTPSVGATYAIWPGIAAYASYAESFQPQSGTQFAGGTIAPERGHQYETGFKFSLLDNKLNATASLYQLTRANIATSDAAHPGFSVVTGEQQSQGFELDSQAILMPGWEVIAAYTYVDAKVTRDNVYPIGNHPQGVAPTELALWTKYTLQDGPLKGLGAMVGGYFYASQWGDLPNTFRLPAYQLVDAGLSYDFGQYSLQFTVKNLLDQRYADGAYNDIYVKPGLPRNVLARVAWKL